MSTVGGEALPSQDSRSVAESVGDDLDIPTLKEPGYGQEASVAQGEEQSENAMAQRNTPRVTTNPFAAASDDFFPSGQRKRLFDQLRHLSQWSRRALLVTGESGSGKTVLYQHLARALSKDASAAALVGSEVADQHGMFEQLTEQFGIDHADEAPTELLNDLLRGYVLAQNDAERLCVILVDDAHELDAAALEALLSLSADCRVRLIFFGNAALAKLVDKATVNLEIACHETPLLPLSATDSRTYIEWRTRQLGYAQMPFNEEQLATLYSATDGIPGQIDVLASHMLQDLANSGAAHQRPTPALLPVRQFPLQHLWVALALAAVLGLFYLLLDGPADAPESGPVVEVGAELGAELSSERAVDAGTNSDKGAVMQASEQASPLFIEQDAAAAPAAVSPSAVAKEAAAAEERLAQLLAERQALEREAAEAAALEAAVAEVAAAEVAAAEAAAAAQRPAEAQATERAAAKAAAAKAGAETDASATASSDVVAQVPGLKGSDWLLARDGNHFTVQLVTLASRDGIIKYLREQTQVERFAIYTRKSDGQTLYVATYGSYGSRAQAQAAARTLPASVGKITPWIRTLKDVQQTIRAAN